MTQALNRFTWLSLALLLLSSAWARPARALAFQSADDLQAGGGYSEQQGQDGSFGYVGHLQAIPMLKVGGDDFLVAAIDASDNGRGVVREVGNTLPAFFTQSLLLTGEPEWKHLFAGGAFALSAYGVATHGYLQDDPDEALGEGTYDYEIYGGGVKAELKNFWLLNDIILDLGDMHRCLPNYHSSPAGPEGNENYYTLDSWSPEFQATLSRGEYQLYYSLTSSDYTDSYQYLSSGLIDGTLRNDWLNDLRLSWSSKLGDHYKLGLAGEGTYTNSNYDTYDFNNAVFFQDYMSNSTLSLGPSLSYFRTDDPKGDMLGVGWVIKYTHYIHRPIFNPDGSLAQGTEDDCENTFSIFGRKGLMPHLSVFANADLDMQQSNQSEAQGVDFDYQIFDSQLGLEYQY
jgi:hypothetical protein